MYAAALVCGILGLIIGSFLNVLILRRGAKTLLGRSGCLSCNHQLESIDLIPILSWLFLRGRCRHCGSRISIQYPLVEGCTGILFALIGAALVPQGTLFSAIGFCYFLDALALAALFVAVAAYDIRHTIIPDEWAYAIAALALLSHVLSSSLMYQPWLLILLTGPLAALPFALLWLISGGRWMGLGDAKLALGIGWLLGPIGAWLAITLAFVIGALVSVFILLPLPRFMRALHALGITRGRGFIRFTMKSEVAFGPFLVLGCLVVWIFTLYQVDPVTLLLLF